jgi:GNAT superfamily N-acetyltransferase
MTIVLREMTREAADAILAGERPGDVRVAEDYPTEFSAGVAQCVGVGGQFGPFFLHRAEDDLVVGEIGGAFVDDEATIEIGYAVVESQWNRGYATEAVEAIVTKAREAATCGASWPIRRSSARRAAACSRRRASQWRGKWMMRTRRETSCASRSGSWRSRFATTAKR